jgi:hypothetical protein
MEFVGGLERLFATSLYPLRVPIAIGLALAFVALIVVARRRGWAAAARRHPVRSALIGAIVLVVAVPAAWYLGSPLFIRTAVVESAPSANPVAESAVPASPTLTPEASDVATAAPSPGGGSGAAPELRGAFRGADDFHFGSGTARLIETAPGEFTVRFEGFSVRNGPDLYVYLSPSPDGYAGGAIELGRLKATDGDFNTTVPSGIDVSGVQSVIIWCKQFAVLFAVAELT